MKNTTNNISDIDFLNIVIGENNNEYDRSKILDSKIDGLINIDILIFTILIPQIPFNKISCSIASNVNSKVSLGYLAILFWIITIGSTFILLIYYFKILTTNYKQFNSELCQDRFFNKKLKHEDLVQHFISVYNVNKKINDDKNHKLLFLRISSVVILFLVLLSFLISNL